MQDGGRGHQRDDIPVGQREEVIRALRMQRTAGDAEALSLDGVGAPFCREGHFGHEGVEGEVEHGVDELGRVGDDGVGC